MQVIVMTSDKSDWTLGGFMHCFNTFWSPQQEVTICGFTNPTYSLPPNAVFRSIGKFEDYPHHLWSDALIRVLDTIAEDCFLLYMDDFWFTRPVDQAGIRIVYDYLGQFRNVLKIDLAMDRLYSDPGFYAYGYNTYAYAGHLDLIKSRPGSHYQMSLWGGAWNREVMKRFIVPGESAQQIELSGTPRVSAAGDEVLVLGTRQAPILHGNILQSGKTGVILQDGGWQIPPDIVEQLKTYGYL